MMVLHVIKLQKTYVENFPSLIFYDLISSERKVFTKRDTKAHKLNAIQRRMQIWASN